MKQPVVADVSPVFQGLVDHVIGTNKISLSTEPVVISNVTSGLPSVAKAPSGDRFILSLPFAGRKLLWRIIFNAKYPNCPPDIDPNDWGFVGPLNVNEFENGFDSLQNWNPENPTALLDVIRNFYSMYHGYQDAMLRSTYPELSNALQSVMDELDLHSSQVEVICVRPSHGSSYSHNTYLATVLIRLRISTDDICQEFDLNPEDVVGNLEVKFSGTELQHMCPRLHLQRFLFQLLKTEFSEIPVIGTAKLHEYVKAITTYVNDAVQSALQKRELRRELISSIICHVEDLADFSCDGENFFWLKLKLEGVGDFEVVVSISLPEKFPNQKPVISLCYEVPIGDTSLTRTVAKRLNFTYGEHDNIDALAVYLLSEVGDEFSKIAKNLQKKEPT